MRILHLVDDWIFTDGPVSVFEGLNVDNKFIVLRDNDDITLTKVKSAKVEVIKVGSSAYHDLLYKEKWDLVWVTQLTPLKAQFVLALKKSIPVVWSAYGIDYIKYSGYWLYGTKTTLLFLKFAKLKSIFLTLGAYFLGKTRFIRFIPKLECRFFNRINYFSCIVPEEEPWIRNVIGWRKTAKPVKFYYVSPQSSKLEYPLVNLSVKSIWIGNSCTLSNNHLEVFSLISKNPYYADYDIFIPLSYSYGIEEGKLDQIIMSEGKKKFGERFKPITEFMPRSEYVNLMSSCSIFIFGVKRQQAVGNICIALLCGGCVFLDTKNPAYQHYKNMGVVVYPLERISEGFDKILEEFKPHQKNNIEILSQFDNNRMIAEIGKTVEFLKNETCKS